jgi:hypothetical protein
MMTFYWLFNWWTKRVWGCPECNDVGSNPILINFIYLIKMHLNEETWYQDLYLAGI